MDITFKLDDASLDAIATEVTRRVLVQLGRANDEIPCTKDAPVAAPTVADEDPNVTIGKLGEAYSLAELRDLAKAFIVSNGAGARDALKTILSESDATSLTSLNEDQYVTVADKLKA